MGIQTKHISMDLASSVYKCTRDLQRYDESTRQRIRDAVANGTRAVYRTAVAKAPVKTGALRQGIVMALGTDPRFASGVIKSTVFRGSFVEFGTKERTVKPKRKKAMKIGDVFVRGEIYNGKVIARPFMRPAIEQERPKIEEAIRRAVQEGAR